jgi:membrane protein involved in colicin uptake
MASEENTGMFWSKEASEAVQNNLVRDVVGMDKSICCDTKRHLDKGQVPDGSHDGEKAPTLKKEQTPDQSKSLDSGIVEKSHGKVNKEASEEPVACDDKAKKEEESKEAAAAAESAAAKAKKEKEEAAAKKKAEETAEAVKEMKKAKDATVAPVTEEKDATLEDSFELGDAMDEITLDAAEQDKLSQLFA